MADELNVKDMKLYSEAQSIEADLAALGHGPDKPFDVSVLWTFDQLHYHGVDSVQHAIDLLPIQADESVLEVGAGWGGPSRYIAASAKADVTALELQEDFHTVGQSLTARAGLADRVTHRLGDFLTEDFGEARFDHLVSWLALYHIPDRPFYTRRLFDLLKPGGTLFIEDLMRGPDFAATDEAVLSRELFSNSMVSEADYVTSLESAGFEIIEARNMTDDWRDFTRQRLSMFDGRQDAFIAIHGEALFRARRHFYSKIVEYFTANAIGGFQVAARRPA